VINRCATVTAKSGKTSLLDLLAGRLALLSGARSSGSISVNGSAATPAQMRAISGYVAQEDVLPGALTVYEHLLFHARLRLCGDAAYATAAALSVRVLEVLGQLGLGLVAG
jgi:ATP-binding cassette, subfamily G (WHITE), member 2